MKISIITVCKNAEKTIGHTISSVHNQDYEDIEHIIIDGLSTDGTLSEIEKNKGRVSRIISEPDKGIYDAMNKGIKISTGDVIGILNADDVYSTSSIIREVAELYKKGGFELLYGNVIFHNESGEIKRKWQSRAYDKNMFFDGSFPPHPSMFLTKKAYERFGFYRTDFKISADFEMFLRLLKKFDVKSHFMDKPISNMSLGGASNKNIKNIIHGIKECKLAFKLNGLRCPLSFTMKTLLFRFKQFI